MQRGGQAADVWVVSDKPVERVSLLPQEGEKLVRNSAGWLPSRAAANLIWLGRSAGRQTTPSDECARPQPPSPNRNSSGDTPRTLPAAKRSAPTTVRRACGNARANHANSSASVRPRLTST